MLISLSSLKVSNASYVLECQHKPAPKPTAQALSRDLRAITNALQARALADHDDVLSVAGEVYHAAISLQTSIQQLLKREEEREASAKTPTEQAPCHAHLL